MIFDRKGMSPFSSPVEGQKVKERREESPAQGKSSSKTSLEPLYHTTDQYRQVIKPMKVEDFLY